LDLVEQYLANIEKNKHLNAFVEVYDAEAREQAQAVDIKIKEGNAGRLAGMVVGLKDVLCHEGHGLQASSKILSGFKSLFNATAVQRLLDEDAIVIGRQNCDEFAMGSSNENSAFGHVLNAADNTRVPGGSSGGSAVAVQADMCLVSLGSDTGGSVRQPASYCGIIGLKPTYSRVSRYGLIAYASSFDCIGVMSKSIDNVALVMEIIAGSDDYDSTVSRKPVPNFSTSLDFTKKSRIGYLKEAVESDGVSPEIRQKTLLTIEKLKSAGHILEQIELPLIEYVLPTYYILTTAEASSNLSRYDGVRYGYRSVHTSNMESMYKKSRSEAFGKEVQKRIMLGTFVLSASYYDAYFTKAQKVRRLIKEGTDKLLEKYDFILTPTAPDVAFKIGEMTHDPLAMYLSDIFTVHANLAGIPAISIPNGVDANGLPIGIQILSGQFKETELLAFSNYLINLN
jgi:aspartyl-tRNA(Asn)/glutamyl-tRNA(Gln) amidotransferase subunit A